MSLRQKEAQKAKEITKERFLHAAYVMDNFQQYRLVNKDGHRLSWVKIGSNLTIESTVRVMWNSNLKLNRLKSTWVGLVGSICHIENQKILNPNPLNWGFRVGFSQFKILANLYRNRSKLVRLDGLYRLDG